VFDINQGSREPFGMGKRPMNIDVWERKMNCRRPMQIRTHSRISVALFLAAQVLTGLVGFSTESTGAPRPPDSPIVVRPPGATPNNCVGPLGKGTNHGSINAPEIWTAAGSPHVVPFNIEIKAQVIMQPCAIVRIAAGSTITISGNGALIAAGMPGYPVIIQPQAMGMEWSSIRNFGGVLSLSHAILAGGGAPLNFNPAYIGALVMQTTGTVGLFHVDDVEITGSRSDGVFINGDIGFDATSQNLRVNYAQGFPVHIVARVVGSVPSGTYTLNGHDAIAIAGVGPGGPVVSSQTMHDRGVPYHVGTGQEEGRMDVGAPTNAPPAVLTIEPGVRILFPPSGSLNIGTISHSGALVAVGTAAQPVVFTSDQGPASAAGNWVGITFNDPVGPASTMQHVRVEFAGLATVTGSSSCPYPGYPSQNNAAIRITGEPSGQFIFNTEIVASAQHGIDRGWKGSPTEDFLASNAFTAVNLCNQTFPSPLIGNCPNSQNPPLAVPCPK
jgi:hypothetical protein